MFSGQQKRKGGPVFSLRAKDLSQAVTQKYGKDAGVIILFAGFENERTVFCQESSFYYFSGVEEPGVVLVIDAQNKTVLYAPNCQETRQRWVASRQQLNKETLSKVGIEAVEMLGDTCAGYQFHPFFQKNSYKNLIRYVQDLVANNKRIFTLCPDNEHEYIEQRLVLQRLSLFIPSLDKQLTDISLLVAVARRRKDMLEIEQLYRAIEITQMAHEAAAQAIQDGVTESEVQASLEYIMTSSQARPSFPSIVATGKNATTLHYTINAGELKDGELVVVDIGAKYNNYCADLTRTYPVSGRFTKRQKELYTIVLDTQEYIAEAAKPGMWLSNKDVPGESLHHMAQKFLAQKGYDKYFPHGIGHFLGLDVHDVGNLKDPLEEGDVITIEPGIYIPQEGIGIRIEDNYWIVKEGAVCLSEGLLKKPEEIELSVQKTWDSEQEQDPEQDAEDDIEH